MQETEHQSTTDRTLQDLAAALRMAMDIGDAMVATQAGVLEVRPLTTRAVDPDGALWFLISAGGDLARDIAARPDLLLVYAEPAKSRFAGIAGRAAIVDDPVRVRALWNAAVAEHFDGPDDPDLRLLRVDALRIDTWTPQGTRLGRWLRQAVAAMADETPPPAAPA